MDHVLRRAPFAVLVAASMACGTPPETVDGGTTPGTDGGTGTEDGGSGGGVCTAQVVIGFFTDADCTVPVMGSSTRTYDTSMSCFGWEGTSSAGQNSATRFQCFRDRLCYTQHPNTLACDGPRRTDKQARTDVCVLDTEGEMATIYARIVSGTEGCPEAPAGFECPSSAEGAGTDGIVACSM